MVEGGEGKGGGEGKPVLCKFGPIYRHFSTSLLELVNCYSNFNRVCVCYHNISPGH